MDFKWTGAILEPIQEGISDALTAVVPIGVAILGVLIGVRVVSKVIFTFL
jgi:hypothetical protein